MANLPNVRLESAVRFKVKLTDNGVQLNWSSLSDVAALLYSESQKMVAGVASVAVDAEDSKILIVDYAGHKPQYSGIAKLIVRGKYQGREKTFDAPVINFVDSTAQATGVTVVSDPVVSVTLSVQEVSTSMLDDAIAAAFNNAALAQAATASANTAASSANTAATNATNKANLADQKATLAQEAATAANTAKTGAETATASANTAAQLAQAKATIAQASATSANSAAALANEKATLADQKAALAQEKATAAQTAANNATTAAQSANSAAQAATTATATIQASLVDYRKAEDQDAIDATKASASEVTQLSSEIGDLSELETTDKSSLVNAINEARQSGGGGGSTTIVDNLESDSTTSALSAKQGKVLKGLVDAKPSNNDVMLLGSATGIQYSQHVYGSQAFESLVVKSFSLDNFGSERLSAFLTYGYTDDGNIYFKFIDLYGGGKIRLQNIAVPIADTDATNKSYVDTAVGGKYTKPSGGIPKTDLASAVQTSLGKADTALQSHQDISGKADKITSANSGTAFDANKIYKLGTISGTQSFSLNASSEAYAEYMIEFSTGDTAPSITWNMPNIKWMGGTAPTINANKSYYVSILDNLAVCGEF